MGEVRYGAVLATLGLGLLIYFGLPLEQPIRAGLTIMLVAGLLWFTEAVPLTFTALLIPVLAVVLGVDQIQGALSHFANPIIFLFLGGFALAAALTKQRLDIVMGNHLLRIARSRPVYASYALFAVTALISMWISNTATAAMMLPVALGVAANFSPDNQSVRLFLLLGMAYSASIGGIATLIGSPPNAIAAAAFQLSFMDWLTFGLPAALILLPVMVALLQWLIRPDFRLPESIQPASGSLSGVTLQASSRSERRKVLVIFAVVAGCWVFSTPLSKLTGIPASGFDSLVALGAILALGLSGSLTWREIENQSHWGILLLFGGGIALSAILKSTGTSAFIGEHVGAWLAGQPLLVTLLVIAGFVIFLTELVSNTACAALLIPLFSAVAEALNISPMIIGVLVAVAASCAFMLPVATPPNAIVFGSGEVPQSVMIRNGLWLNLTFTVILSLSVWGLLRVFH
jgi:sodium-dependent dicarboxylate transporter 2/3/5